MAGSKLSSIFFALSGIMLLAQTGLALVYDDYTSAFLAIVFAIIMFCGIKAAATGEQMPLYRTVGGYDIGDQHVEIREFTGEFTDSAPVCGCCLGVLLLVIAYLFIDLLSYSMGESEALLLVSPTIAAGILGIMAGVIYIVQTRG